MLPAHWMSSSKARDVAPDTSPRHALGLASRPARSPMTPLPAVVEWSPRSQEGPTLRRSRLAPPRLVPRGIPVVATSRGGEPERTASERVALPRPRVVIRTTGSVAKWEAASALRVDGAPSGRTPMPWLVTAWGSRSKSSPGSWRDPSTRCAFGRTTARPAVVLTRPVPRTRAEVAPDRPIGQPVRRSTPGHALMGRAPSVADRPVTQPHVLSASMP
jgi:hypothetical protein